MMRIQKVRKSVLGIPIWTDSLILISMNVSYLQILTISSRRETCQPWPWVSIVSRLNSGSWKHNTSCSKQLASVGLFPSVPWRREAQIRNSSDASQNEKRDPLLCLQKEMWHRPTVVAHDKP